MIDEIGTQMGVVLTSRALEIATERELDLVEVAPQSDPPVCRLMDYGKFKYDRAKKEKDSKKKQHVIQNKEVRFRPGIDVHDMMTKVNRARGFLEEGARIKITVMFRGREMAYIDNGYILIDKIMEQLGDIASVERAPVMEGRFMTTFITPK